MNKKVPKNQLVGKFRLYPNQQQDRILRDHCKASTFLQNKYIELAKKDQKADVKPKFTGKGGYDKNISRWRTEGLDLDDDHYIDDNGENWAVALLRNTQGRALYYVSPRIQANFFTKGGGSRVGFQALREAASFQTDQLKLEVNEERPKKSHLILSNPQQKGMRVRMRMHRVFPDRIHKSAIIKREGSKWYACIIFEHKEGFPAKVKIKKSVGLDFGVKNHVIDDSNNKYNVKNDRNLQARILRAQQKLSRCKRGSKNRRKAKANLLRLKSKESRKKNYARHHISKELVSNNDAVAVEDFPSKKLVQKMASDKTKLKKVRAASNKKLLHGGSAEIISQLEYKCKLAGKTFKKVPALNTTKTCSCCGYINEELTLSDRDWTCPECDTFHDRDQNAAKNVKKAAFG